MTGPEKDKEQPLIDHLIELRSRLLRVVIFILLLLLVLLPFANSIYQFIATPLLAKLPPGSSMIATEVASPFFAPFKLTLFCAIFVAIPYILYQVWGFIASGLYAEEKKLALPILSSSIILFYVGILFAYFIVFPLLFAFLTTTAPAGIKIMTDINHYLNFILKLFFAFGVSFEIPIATFLVVRAGLVSVDRLAENRPYIILAAFIVGMLLTPPDVISQILLAIPIWILFESGLFISRHWAIKHEAKPEEDLKQPD